MARKDRRKETSDADDDLPDFTDSYMWVAEQEQSPDHENAVDALSELDRPQQNPVHNDGRDDLSEVEQAMESLLPDPVSRKDGSKPKTSKGEK